jgi:RND family efflux transporter MFP subunit
MRNSRPSTLASLSLGAAFAITLVSRSALADDTTAAVTTAQVQRGPIAQPVTAYGIVEASAANLTSINLPYVARVTQLRVQEGQTVAHGEALFVVQADPAAALAAAQARSAVTFADGEVARSQSLFDKGLATTSQLATARKAAQDAREALASQDKSGIVSGSKLVTSPLDGVVVQVSVGQGAQVQAGGPIVQLAPSAGGQGSSTNVQLGVEPADAAAIHPGDTVRLRGLSTALANTTVTGRVVIVGASIDTQSQLVNVGANIALGGTAFIPGTRVAADIDTRRGVHWVVPRSAVLGDDQGHFVYQVASGNKAHRVNVTVLTEDGNRYGVDGALDAKQPVVIGGNYELQDGMTVQDSKGAAQ